MQLRITTGKAFIIGNGTSRKDLNLKSLKDKGLIFGCNALYRDFKPGYEIPDFLVSIDPKMIDEIKKSDFPKERFIVPPPHEQFEPRECNPHQPRSNAGINAMVEAIRKQCTHLYMLGFDFMCQEKEQCVSNIYAESENYKGHEITQAESMSRLNYLWWLVNKAPTVTFTFVFPGGFKIYTPEIKNVNLMVMNDFKNTVLVNK